MKDKHIHLDKATLLITHTQLDFQLQQTETHGGGVEYTEGVTVLGVPGVAGSYVKFKVPTNAPTLVLLL